MGNSSFFSFTLRVYCLCDELDNKARSGYNSLRHNQEVHMPRNGPRPLWKQHIVTFLSRLNPEYTAIGVVGIVVAVLYWATWDSNPLSATQRAKIQPLVTTPKD